MLEEKKWIFFKVINEKQKQQEHVKTVYTLPC